MFGERGQVREWKIQKQRGLPVTNGSNTLVRAFPVVIGTGTRRCSLDFPERTTRIFPNEDRTTGFVSRQTLLYRLQL